MKVSPVRFCSVVKGWMLRKFPGTEEGQQAKDRLLEELLMPLPGESVYAARDIDYAADAAAFDALLKG